MSRLATVLREACGLVVDDATLAAAILVWAAALWLAERAGLVPPAAASVAFAFGLGAILVENVVRRARRGP